MLPLAATTSGISPRSGPDQPFPGVSQGFHSCPVVRYLPKSQVAHNPRLAGSNPAPATIRICYRFRLGPLIEGVA
jgi:hypothetical protein